MVTSNHTPNPGIATWIATLGLASAMGIGRFAFTPLLPMMQQSLGLSLRHGAWLASANYIGYFVGALACLVFNPRPGCAARLSLFAIAILTMAMGLTHAFDAWLILRLLAGVASAYALIGISSWILALLEQWRKPGLAGRAFGGVGLGIMVAGLMCLAAAVWRQSPDHTWIALGVMALAVFVVAWVPLGWSADAGSATDTAPPRRRLTSDEWMLALCYGIFGLGYIIPATFLPAFARQLINDPTVFGWVWPAFGLAALLSTIVVANLFRHTPPRATWAVCHLIIAIGVLAPALSPHMAAILVSTVCVGGTFMVITMEGMREARRVAGASAPRLIAAMTAAFALGQLIGPLTIPAGPFEDAIFFPGLATAGLLLVTVLMLMRGRAATATSAQ